MRIRKHKKKHALVKRFNKKEITTFDSKNALKDRLWINSGSDTQAHFT